MKAAIPELMNPADEKALEDGALPDEKALEEMQRARFSELDGRMPRHP